jgi:hypothetical protein
MMYLARLPCGCIVSACDVSDDETDALWLYHASGNGWTIECVEEGAAIEDGQCADMKRDARLQQMSMF